MEQEYKLHFSKPILKIKDVSDKLPGFCRYPVPMAKKSLLLEFAGTTLLQQTIQCDIFRIDIFQLDSQDDFIAYYSLDQQRIFLNFVLSNPILFKSVEGVQITWPNTCSFYLSAEQAGNYRVECNRGSTDLVVISLDPDWLRRAISPYPILSQALAFLLVSHNPFDVLPHFRIDQAVRQWLFAVLAFDHENPIAQLGELQKYIAMSLHHYEQLLGRSNRTQLYLIKLHIDQHYSSVELDLNRLPHHLALTDTSIVRRFKKEYGTTIRNYCIRVRMQQAHRLLTQENKPISEVYLAVGYINENSFRKAYRKYLLQLSHKAIV